MYMVLCVDRELDNMKNHKLQNLLGKFFDKSAMDKKVAMLIKVRNRYRGKSLTIVAGKINQAHFIFYWASSYTS